MSLPKPSAWVEVDLDRLAANLEVLRRRSRGSEIIPVVKADAYGHGSIEVARRLVDEGVERLAVARLAEAATLRRSGIDVELWVLGPSRNGEIAAYRDLSITPILSSLAQVAMWAEASGSLHGVHLKVDTGMHRLGIPMAHFEEALTSVRTAPSLRLDGVCSHLAEGESPESERNTDQIRRFQSALGLLSEEELDGVLRHLGASSSALHLREASFDGLRVGLSLYGYDSAGREGEALAPVMTVTAELIDIRTVPTGGFVGYDSTWTAPRNSRLGVLGIGYADGLPRSLSNRGEVLVHGQRAPIVGRISMDLTLVDLTDTAAALGDRVILLGQQESERLDAAEIARSTGTIPYEIVCSLGALRLPRFFRDSDGERGESASMENSSGAPGTRVVPLLRKAQSDDLEYVASWVRSAKECLLWTSKRVTYPIDRSTLAADIGLDQYLSFTLTLGELPVAFGQLVSKPNRRFHFSRLIVETERRGEGIGRALVRSLVDEAIAREVQTISLKVDPSNARALALYRSVGFAECEPPADEPDMRPSLRYMELQRRAQPHR